MKNCKTSVGTAAQKSSKRSWLFRSALLLAIPMLSAVYSVKAQEKESQLDKITDYIKLKSDSITSGVTFYSNNHRLLQIKDSCWWVNKIDTIKTEFVILIDENNFVKKQRADFIVHKYEIEECQYRTNGFYMQPKRNEVMLLNNLPVEILLYKSKRREGMLLVGNSR